MGFFTAPDAFLFPEKGRAFRPCCSETADQLIDRLRAGYQNVAAADHVNSEARALANQRIDQLNEICYQLSLPVR